MIVDAAEFQSARMEAFVNDHPPNVQLAMHTSAVDTILRWLFLQHLNERATDGIALVALGGFGRAELAPYSDLDLLIVHRGWASEDIEAINRAVMYPLWDAGCDVGNRVRTISEMVSIVSRLDEATAVIDARLIEGDARLFEDTMTAVAADSRRQRARLLRDLRHATSTRHASHGHCGHLLEPDIRDAQGGLRDVQTLGWISAITPGPDSLAGLTEAGLLSTGDAAVVREADEFLKRTRIALHLHNARRTDTLYLPDQDAIAARLGYEDTDALVGGDSFMRDLYTHARSVAEITESVMEAADAPLVRRRFTRRSDVRTVAGGYVIKSGRLEVLAAPSVHEDPSGWIEAFVAAMTHDVPVGRASIARLSELIGGRQVPFNKASRDALFALLLAGRRAQRQLEALSSSGLMSAMIAGWDHVRALPQRNLYHRFTVDVHLLETVMEASASRDLDDPDIADAWSHVGDPMVVLLACLMHDIGKGRDADHSLVGAEIANGALRSMGMDDATVADVEWLVRDHLLLAETATRRDIADPAIVQDLVLHVRDARRLSMLYLLTRADAIATGPEAWSTFRASLVRELYQRALASLGLREPVGARSALPEWVTLNTSEVNIQTHLLRGDAVDELVVVASDRPGLFAAVTGVLALRSVNVLAADLVTLPDGTAVETYKVRGSHGLIPDERWEQIQTDITSVVSGALDIDRAIAERKTPSRSSRTNRRPTRVFVEATSAGQTLIEVHAGDRPGLLRRLAKAIYEGGCDVHLARIATYGTEVVDVFYVTASGGKALDTEHVQRVVAAVIAAADR